MLSFVNDDKSCRSQKIANYFGDNSTRPCGICDNCLKIKNASFTQEEFDQIHTRIITLIENGAEQTAEILIGLGENKKQKTWKVIEFLQSENKLDVDKNGKIKLK